MLAGGWWALQEAGLVPKKSKKKKALSGQQLSIEEKR